jgi:hypothetical protein
MLGVSMKRLLLHWIARVLGVHMKIDGLPYGARPDHEVGESSQEDSVSTIR